LSDIRSERASRLRYNPRMNRVFEPDERLSALPWPPVFRFGCPRNFRRFIFYVFVFTSIGFLVPGLYGLSRYHNMPLLRILLVSPIFDFCVVALSGIAALTIWKAHPSARGWAIAASLPFLFIFIRPVLIPMHPVLDHNLFALVVGLIGISAFVWPD
jgi:hypothetical protein